MSSAKAHNAWGQAASERGATQKLNPLGKGRETTRTKESRVHRILHRSLPGSSGVTLGE